MSTSKEDAQEDQIVGQKSKVVTQRGLLAVDTVHASGDQMVDARTVGSRSGLDAYYWNKNSLGAYLTLESKGWPNGFWRWALLSRG